MSFSRYINASNIIESNNPTFGQLYTDEDLRLIRADEFSPYDPDLITDNNVEIHLYSLSGNRLGFDPDAKYLILDNTSNTLLVNIREVFRLAGIDRGQYKFVVNFIKPLFGHSAETPLYLKEISPDRTEVKLDLVPDTAGKNTIPLQQFVTEALNYKSQGILNHVVLNFGLNRLAKVTNIKFSTTTTEVFFKLYQPLDIEITEKDLAWIGFEVIDPYIDTVLLTQEPVQKSTYTLKRPNFDIDGVVSDSNSTIYKTWNDLLDSDTTTNQRLIDTFLSGSDVEINIDYTDFNNFVFYSSAEERIRNFKTKLETIEFYRQQNSTYSNSSGSAISFVTASIKLYQKRIDGIVSAFDGFERWLYYEPTSSLFTHDVSGSVTPWPKYLSGSRWYLHHTTSSIAQTWYAGNLSSASLHDSLNQNSLRRAIPDHIGADENNSQFVLFVDMFGHFYDELYAYVRALLDIHERDEHPKRGTQNALIPIVAESFGWQLQNIHPTTNLWLYGLGVNKSGSIDVPSGSLASQSHRDLNYQVWKRVVNNLPHLLKTKGTSRSVKALMSIYGIPHTLISIKEYGGPGVSKNRPSIVEDRFSYALNLNSNSWIRWRRKQIPVSSGSWGGDERLPDTAEFRFKTKYSSSVSMSIWSVYNDAQKLPTHNLELVHVSAKPPFSSSYSGSKAYGFLRYTGTYTQGSVQRPSVTSSLLPIFDNDFWNVRIYTTTPLPENGVGSVSIQIAKSQDCVSGQIPFSASMTWTTPPAATAVRTAWGFANSTTYYGILGGVTESGWAGNNSSRFSGSIQAYKEYYELINEETFFSHAKNPAAYHGNNPSSSFYTLYRYYPLGVDVLRHDHTTFKQVSSSQPNRAVSIFTTASFFGFTGTQDKQYSPIRETYYINTPTLGGFNITNEKIRIEGSKLLFELSPEQKAEKSHFDEAPNDSNRLAIVFSPTDQINRDIYDHIGFLELDDYIGDPEEEFENRYRNLINFSEQYWRKYTRNNNINEFVKIFSVFGYSFFEQVRQLIPARANYLGGVLIEPNVLQRSKVQLTRRPKIENPQWDQMLNLNPRNPFGEYLTYTSSISVSSSMGVDYIYNTSSVFISSSFSVDYFYYTSSIRMYDPYTGSRSQTQSIIDNCLRTCKFKEVIFYYSSSQGSFPNRYLQDFATFVSKSYGWYYSRSLSDACYQYADDCMPINRARFIGSRLEGPDFNIDSDETIDGGPVVSWREVNPNEIIITDIPDDGNIRVG